MIIQKPHHKKLYLSNYYISLYKFIFVKAMAKQLPLAFICICRSHIGCFTSYPRSVVLCTYSFRGVLHQIVHRDNHLNPCTFFLNFILTLNFIVDQEIQCPMRSFTERHGLTDFYCFCSSKDKKRSTSKLKEVHSKLQWIVQR